MRTTNSRRMIYLKTIIFINILLILEIWSFSEYSIFDDEDIYNQALPPILNTGITAPGTKWCGPGNTAANYDDLGTTRETDICCRAHDHCEEIAEPGETIHGLENSDFFPRLKCTCEQTFLNCLQKVNSMVSNTLGRVYFGTRRYCFNKGYPIIECKSYHDGVFRARCIRYKVDKTKPEIWQFYEIPFYSYGRS